MKEFDYNRKSIRSETFVDKIRYDEDLPLLLGQWHDCQVMIRHMNKVATKSNKELAKIEKRIAKDSNQLLKRIMKSLRHSAFRTQQELIKN
jgi:hypothetical protein